MIRCVLLYSSAADDDRLGNARGLLELEAVRYMMNNALPKSGEGVVGQDKNQTIIMGVNHDSNRTDINWRLSEPDLFKLEAKQNSKGYFKVSESNSAALPGDHTQSFEHSQTFNYEASTYGDSFSLNSEKVGGSEPSISGECKDIKTTNGIQTKCDTSYFDEKDNFKLHQIQLERNEKDGRAPGEKIFTTKISVNGENATLVFDQAHGTATYKYERTKCDQGTIPHQRKGAQFFARTKS